MCFKCIKITREVWQKKKLIKYTFFLSNYKSFEISTFYMQKSICILHKDTFFYVYAFCGFFCMFMLFMIIFTTHTYTFFCPYIIGSCPLPLVQFFSIPVIMQNNSAKYNPQNFWFGWLASSAKVKFQKVSTFVFQDYNDEIRQEQLRELSYLNGSEDSSRGRGIRGRGIRVPPAAPSRCGNLSYYVNSFTKCKQ